MAADPRASLTEVAEQAHDTSTASNAAWSTARSGDSGKNASTSADRIVIEESETDLDALVDDVLAHEKTGR